MALTAAFLKTSRALWVRREKKYKAEAAHAHAMHKRRDQQLAALAPAIWHPTATRDPEGDAGPFVTGKPKLVWHTTEGTSLPDYNGTSPHFTIDPTTGHLWQHIPINRSAKALLHPTGTVETNRAHAIQVEIIGFAANTPKWSTAAYEHLAELARWIERNAGVDRRCGVKFITGAARLAGQAWLDYDGHCGHCHVPNNDHTDPGNGFRIDLVI